MCSFKNLSTLCFKSIDNLSPPETQQVTKDKSNFFFLRPIGNTFDVFIFFSVDYNGPGTGANYSLDINDNQYYSQHSIVWLLSVLDKYRNHIITIRGIGYKYVENEE